MHKKNKTFIIAEAGVNHNGKLSLGKKLIDIAKKIGADAVKFQIFKTENVITKKAPLCTYQKKNNFKNKKSLFEYLKKLELKYSDFEHLALYCKKKKIEFMCTADEIEGLNEIKRNIKKIKIGSSELNDLFFLEQVAKLNKITFLSTGLSNFEDVKKSRNFLIKKGLSKNKIYLLHCNSAYPSPNNDLNLNVLRTYKEYFGKNVGFSDHSSSIISSVLSVALGAKVVEKHLTLSKKLEGPDHQTSLNPSEFKQMIEQIRCCEVMLGSSIKKITDSEMKNFIKIKKGIYARTNILKGEKFTEKNICIKRPYNGTDIGKFKRIIGKKSKKCYTSDESIYGI
jgi:N,N'-diacetyllegionaminate synthase